MLLRVRWILGKACASCLTRDDARDYPRVDWCPTSTTDPDQRGQWEWEWEWEQLDISKLY